MHPQGVHRHDPGVVGTPQKSRISLLSPGYVNLDRGRKPPVRWLDPAWAGAATGVAAISQISFVSTLPAEHYHQLEVLLFFNGRQHRVRKGIEMAISRYGAPEIVDDGKQLRVRVGGETDAQCQGDEVVRGAADSCDDLRVVYAE